MSVIYPSLFFIIERFPDHKKALHRLYTSDKDFQSLCENYRQCSEALRYWGDIHDPGAADRHREYGELLHELEMEIMRYCSAHPH